MVDIKNFCAKYADSKEPHPLSEPWTCNGKTYSCDGHMIIRVDALAEVTRGLPEILEKSDGFKKLQWIQPGQDLTQFPLYEPQKKEKCRTCKGSGKAATCPECDGDGCIEFDSGYHNYTWDCRTCDGEGVVATIAESKSICPNCMGSCEKPVDPFEYVDVGDVRLAKALLDKIKDLPGVCLGKTVGVENKQVPFIFDGGDGVLMCMEK